MTIYRTVSSGVLIGYAFQSSSQSSMAGETAANFQVVCWIYLEPETPYDSRRRAGTRERSSRYHDANACTKPARADKRQQSLSTERGRGCRLSHTRPIITFRPTDKQG